MLSSECPEGDVCSWDYCVISELSYQCWIEERVASDFLVDIAYNMQLKIEFFSLLFEYLMFRFEDVFICKDNR